MISLQKAPHVPELIKIDTREKLYTFKCGGGYSCLGFEVLERRCVALSCELVSLGYSLEIPAIMGSAERFGQYRERQELARLHHLRTGYRFHCELTKALVGLEGRRVEVTHLDGRKVRFQVGKSTGWIPCHLAIHNSRSTGGMPADVPEGATIRIIR